MPLLLASAIFALASTGAMAADPIIVNAPPQEDKVVCKRQGDSELGSHMQRPKKVCMRASEWKYLEAVNDDAKRRIADRPSRVSTADRKTMGGN